MEPLSNRIEYWIHKYNQLYSKNNWKETGTSFLKMKNSCYFYGCCFYKIHLSLESLPLWCPLSFLKLCCGGASYFFGSILQIKENIYVHHEQLLTYFNVWLIWKGCRFGIQFLKSFKNNVILSRLVFSLNCLLYFHK